MRTRQFLFFVFLIAVLSALDFFPDNSRTDAFMVGGGNCTDSDRAGYTCPKHPNAGENDHCVDSYTQLRCLVGNLKDLAVSTTVPTWHCTGDNCRNFLLGEEISCTAASTCAGTTTPPPVDPDTLPPWIIE